MSIYATLRALYLLFLVDIGVWVPLRFKRAKQRVSLFRRYIQVGQHRRSRLWD